MKPGAALRLTDGTYAQLVTLLPSPGPPAAATVVRLTKDPENPHQLLLGDDPLVDVPRSDIDVFADIDDLTSMRAHRRAWRSVGLRLATVSCTGPDVFVPLSGVPKDAMVAVGGNDDDDGEEEVQRQDEEELGAPSKDLHGYAADDGFVVAEGAFTIADANESEFAADTHDAVHAFEDWVPQSDKERKFRTFVASLEQKYVHLDDEEQFAAGKGGIAYSRPPRKKKRRKRGEGRGSGKQKQRKRSVSS